MKSYACIWLLKGQTSRRLRWLFVTRGLALDPSASRSFGWSREHAYKSIPPVSSGQKQRISRHNQSQPSSAHGVPKYGPRVGPAAFAQFLVQKDHNFQIVSKEEM